jgi:formimidoylglutamate deiminase
LWQAAATGGAQAMGRRTGAIAVGSRADLVVLNEADCALAGQPVDCVVDAAIFGPVRQPVRDVMSGGRWIVRDGRHPEEEQVARRYREVLASVRWNGGM